MGAPAGDPAACPKPALTRLLEILSAPEASLPLGLQTQVLDLQTEAWPAFRSRGLGPKHDPALRPISMLLVNDGRVLAALDILSKEIVHGGETYAVSGLSTVVTDERNRRKGHGSRLVEAARETMRAARADLAIFTCDTPLAPFYESAGFEILEGTVLIGGTAANPFPSDRFDKVTLACFFTARAKRHAADFVGARIELHPGEVDRLW